MSGPAKPLAPDLYERVLALGAAFLLILALVALARGRAAWDKLSAPVVLHLLTVLLPLALTPVMLLRRRGDGAHRVIGWVWAALMFATAAISFAIHGAGQRLSFIHVLSGVVIVTVPLLVVAARRHNLARHRRAARGIVTGAVLLAGYFALAPGRLLGTWLWD